MSKDKCRKSVTQISLCQNAPKITILILWAGHETQNCTTVSKLNLLPALKFLLEMTLPAAGHIQKSMFDSGVRIVRIPGAAL